MFRSFAAIAFALACGTASPLLALDNCAEEAAFCPYEVVRQGDPVHTTYECKNDVEGSLPMAAKLNPSKGTEVLRRGCNWLYINGVRQATPCSTTTSTTSVACAEK